MKLLDALKNNKKYSKLLPYAPVAVIVFGFAVTGLILTVASHAATYSAPKEAESGTVAGNAAAKLDATNKASGGQYIGFGTTGGTTPPTTPPVTPPASSPSGVPMPVGDLTGWKQIFADDFTVDAAKGSWGSECDADKIVYTGAAGTKWKSYPNCFKDTYDSRPYRADEVLSVHDGVLDFFLHQVDGQPAGANPSPVVTGSSQYQTYGRYAARFKVDTPGLSEYYVAWLLWPQNESDWQCAESDYPEGGLDGTVGGFHHFGCSGDQDEIDGGGAKYTDWHTYTQEWMPGSRKYYVDDKLVATSNNQVYSKPQRWQLQTETNGSGNHSGHLLVDWVAVYSKQ